MSRVLLSSAVLILVVLSASLHAEEASMIELDGIELGMNKKEIIDNWGFPDKRETKYKKDVWYYTNEGTPHPTDGIIVNFEKGKVKEWKVVDNWYRYMKIWGKKAEESGP